MRMLLVLIALVLSACSDNSNDSSMDRIAEEMEDVAKEMEDVAFAVAPLSRPEARAVMSEIKGFPILEGIRGGAAADLRHWGLRWFRRHWPAGSAHRRI